MREPCKTGGKSSPDSPEPWPERRQVERYNLDSQITAKLLPEGKEEMRGHSLDISVAGIAGVFATGWDVGTHVLLEFPLPVCTERLQVEAVVRNRNEYRYGFEFINLRGRDRFLIQKVCRVLALLQ